MRLRPLEGGTDNALDPLRRVHVLRDVLVLVDVSSSQVYALSVLAEDYEIDRAVGAKRREIGVQQLDRAKIDVEIEAEPEAQEDVPSVLVCGHARVPQRAEQDRVHVVPQMAERVVGKRLLGLQVVVSGVGKPLEVESKPVLRRRPLEHRDRGFDDLGADPVPGDHRDLVPLHSKPVARPQLTQ